MELDNYTIALFVGVFIIGYLIGQLVGYFKAIQSIAEGIADRVLNRREDSGDTYPVSIEKYNNQYMAYGENHLFLAQGNTLSDLVSRVFDRIPDNHSLTFNHEGHLSAEEIKELVSSLKSKVESKDTNDTTR